MSRDEVRRMIDEVDDNKDGRLDYREVRAISFLKEIIQKVCNRYGTRPWGYKTFSCSTQLRLKFKFSIDLELPKQLLLF